MVHGYTGKILLVDLSEQKLEIEEPGEDFYRQYIGGSLMGLYYLWKNTPAGTGALEAANTVTFAISAPTGLPVSGQSRCTMTCLSPSSGGVADSQAGGFWPAELKFAGFDAIVISGAAERPVYLLIDDGKAEIRDADHLWGKLTNEVDAILDNELGKGLEVAQIGPAGEKLSNFAAVMNMSNRAWGRTGVGAVLGSKKLKAIVVRGSDKCLPADRKAVTSLARKGVSEFPGSEMDDFGRYGTPDTVMGNFGGGGLPTKNWDSGTMEQESAEAISGDRLYDELLRGADEGKQDSEGRDTCFACIVRCKRVVESEWKGRPLTPVLGGPEYETIATFGSYCDVDDLHAITLANQLCNQYGVDTISCGATLSWAMDCFENGLLTTEEMDGIELRYGDADAMIAMLEKTLKREGFGDILANGSKKAADILGKGHEYLLTVKGQELPAHMPHVKRSLAVIYATNPFGADHQSSEHDTLYTSRGYEGTEENPGYKRFLNQIDLFDPQHPKAMNEQKIDYALKTQYSYSAMDTLSLCQFVFGPSWQLYGPVDMANLMTAATGWEITVEEVQQIGRRRLNLMRALNAREGITRDKDTLPKKLFKKALEGGRTDGMKLAYDEFQHGIEMYYRQAGWDLDTGIPKRETLVELGLDWVADDLGLS